ncbi:MAG: OmpA/MotB family protein [Planctomycetota bacterium]|jgi:chemotaxis protein MotB
MEDDGPPGVPEWVVTYGDMMSLLLTFFIMLVSLSEIVDEKKYRAVVDMLDQYLTGYPTAPVTPPGQHHPANSQFDRDRSRMGSKAIQDPGDGGVKTRAAIGEDLRIKVTNEGTPQQVGNALVLTADGAGLTAESESELHRIARRLSGKPNKIEIRAHCSPQLTADGAEDVDPVALTYRRGRDIMKLLVQWGLEEPRIRVTAAADTMPPDSDASHHLSADRIEIFTTDVFSSEYVGPRW